MTSKTITLLAAILTSAACLEAQTSDYITLDLDYGTPVTALKVTPDGKSLMVGDQEGNFRMLDATSWEEKLVIGDAANAGILDIEMTPKQDVIFLAAGNLIKLFTSDGQPVINWNVHNTTIWSMDIDPSGKFLVSAEMNKTFQLWDIYTGKPVQDMRAHEEPTLAVAFSPDGKYIASGSNDRNVFLWDAETREVIATFQGLNDDIYDVEFSPDGTLLAACSKDKSVRIWNIATRELKYLLKGHRDMVMEIEFSPDGKYLLSASADFAIKLWDMKTGEEIYAYLDNDAAVIDIEFLPGGESFASACMDNHMKVRELNHEIFVLKYFNEPYREEIASNPLFLPRQKGEKRSDFETRNLQAESKRKEIVEKYYREYIGQRAQGKL